MPKLEPTRRYRSLSSVRTRLARCRTRGHRLGLQRRAMSASQILSRFEELPPKEQHEVVTALLQRCGELPDRLLNDDELVGLADELFQTLDAEESDAPQSR